MIKFKFLSNRIVTLIFLLCAITTSCKKESTPISLTSINSSKIFTISSNAITIKSTFNTSKEDSFSNFGVCWSLQSNPTINDNFTNGFLNDSIKYTRIENLIPNTKYYAKVYAKNSEREIYGEEICFTTNDIVTDIEGNNYNTVTIGSQVWMVENLKTTKFNDGTAIEYINNTTNWTEINSPSYCFYNYSIYLKNLYGALYNWQSVNSGKVCPTGWHVPTDADWKKLTDYLGGESISGGLMKSTFYYWESPNYQATNYSGFTALPAGHSGTALGDFNGMGYLSVWWSSTIEYASNSDEGNIITRTLRYDNKTTIRDGFMTKGGAFNFLSIRCIKD